jgi:hypothetical protein
LGSSSENRINGFEMRKWITLVCTPAFLAGCNNSEAEKTKQISSENVYFDYRITGEEGKEIACVLQFRADGPEGPAQKWAPPGRVLLDGEELKADSARLTGFFYEIRKPLNGFEGQHTISCEPGGKQSYQEEFDYWPFQIKELPAKIQRSDIEIKIEGLPPGNNRLHVLMFDTAFANKDVHEILPAREGKILLSREIFNQLVTGPISLEIYSEQERRLKQRPLLGGKIVISYHLKRDFELVE